MARIAPLHGGGRRSPVDRLTCAMDMKRRDNSQASPTENEMAAAFISYSRADIKFVGRLEAALEARGVQARIDRSDIEKGEEWWKRIQQLIAEADTVIFVLSPDFGNLAGLPGRGRLCRRLEEAALADRRARPRRKACACGPRATELDILRGEPGCRRIGRLRSGDR